MSEQYAQVDKLGTVVNVVLWDGESDFPLGEKLVPANDGQGIGWKHIDGKWIAPPPSEEAAPDTSEDDRARAAGIAKLVALGLKEEEALALIGR